MDDQFGEWLDGVRAAMANPPLARSNKSCPGADPKWAIGDALLVVPAEHRDQVATQAGLRLNDARSYWRTAWAWPPYTRTVEASWTVYRELVPLEDRRETIFTNMTVRDAYRARTGKDIDRPAMHRLPDDKVIDELVRLMLSPRSHTVVPQIIERLNSSREGRKAARDRRSTKALRRLDEEIRLVQREIRRRKAEKSPRLRFMEVKRRLLDTEVNVEEIGLLFNDADERNAAAEDEWRHLAERVVELREVASKVARDIIATLDVVDGEAWEESEEWRIPELSGGGEYQVFDAEIVDDD